MSATGPSSASSTPAERLSQHLWRLPLPVTTLPPHDHTNAFLICAGTVALLVDPGSAEPASLTAVQSALELAGAKLLKAIVLTHTHPDHIDGVAPLLAAFDRPTVYAHKLEAPRLPEAWRVVHLGDDQRLTVADITVRCLHTPGHSPGHLTLVVEDPGGKRPEAALVGDLAAAEGSVWVGLPDGDMALYLDSLRRVAELDPRLLGAGHGPAILEPRLRLGEMAARRLEREQQVVDALAQGPQSAPEITRRIYPPLPAPVLELAEKSVLAHLVKLQDEGRVDQPDGVAGPYRLRR